MPELRPQGGRNGRSLCPRGPPNSSREAPEFVRRGPRIRPEAPEFVPNGPRIRPLTALFFRPLFFFCKKITQKSEIWPKKAKFDLI